MNRYQELSILSQIGLGFNDINVVASRALLKKAQVRLAIEQFSKKGLINIQNGLSLSKKGLLELSRGIANQESERSAYIFWSTTGLPYFQYRNKLQKDVIFHPALFFDPARPFADNEKYLAYKTSIPSKNLNFEDLEILYNLLYECEYLHPTGFWLLKCEKKELCGWGFANLRKTLQFVRNPLTLTFVCAFADFIFIIRSDLEKSEFARLKMNIYLTRDRFPYVDTLDFIHDKLKAFLNFHGIKELPRGKEFQLKHGDEWKELPEPKLRFVQEVRGKILHRSNNLPLAVPLVVVLTPSQAKTSLDRVSPWFVTCPGGCLEKELTAKKAHHVHLFRVLSLSEIDVVTLMIST